MRRTLTITALVITALWLGVAPADSQGPRKGGILKVGMIGEPPTLDGHATTAVITREIGINMFEGLYTLDAKLQGARGEASLGCGSGWYSYPPSALCLAT